MEDEDEICMVPSIHEILQSPLGKSKLRSNRNNYYIKTGPKWHYKSKRLLGILCMRFTASNESLYIYVVVVVVAAIA